MRESASQPFVRFVVAASVACLVLAVLALPATAQFGQNKVQYRSFKWRILETEHFNIHYYEEERSAALETARMAERGYEYLSEFFQHEVTDKIPLILYSTHQDFEQSNVIGGFISEGTGGVTESLKGRVTLPLTGSYAELNHVLVHELVHAFQFDLLERNIRGMIGMNQFPLWMMEGMAEWVSSGMDPVTTMWVTDAVKRDKLLSVEKMASVQDIRVYRMGQALFEVIAQRFGTDRIRRMLNRPDLPRRMMDDSLPPITPTPPPAVTTTASRDPLMATTDSLTFAPGSVAVASLDQHWHAWADSIAKTLGADLVDPDSTAERLTEGRRYGSSFHLAPTFSPDGQRVLYYSSRGFTNELFVAERTSEGWSRRSLISGEETPELESLPLLSASADWSPDGRQIVFVATEEGRDALRILDFASRKIVRTLDTELTSISNPSWSPDGRFIAFTALVNGEDDLFLIEIETSRLLRLTQDAYSERTPRWSPSGDALVFATDRGPRTDVEALRFGPWNIARLALRPGPDVPTADRIDLVVVSDANDFAPVFAPSGDSLAFVSDRDGTFQVYTVALASGDIRRRTRFDTGVIGIVPTGPAFSWSATGDLVYSVFRNGGWNLYRTHGFPVDEPGDVQADKLALVHTGPEAITADATPGVVEQDRDYKARLTPEYAVIGALYVGNTGAAGSGQVLLGDMLGNQYLLVGGNLRSQLDESELLVQYANLGRRWQWGLAGYQYRDDIGVYTAPETLLIRSLVRRGVGAQIAYPFNRFRRVEFGLDFESVSDEYAIANFVSIDTQSRSQFYSFVPQVALVHDNASYSGFTPVRGGRWRASIEQSIGDLDNTFGLVDYRRYLNVKRRAAVALRALVASSSGEDTAFLRIGGPDTFRGADYGQLQGTRVAITTAEFRFPIIPSTELIRGVVFVDAAMAWTDDASVKPFESEGPLGVRARDVALAYGFGVRGFIGLPLRFDAALPTDLERNGDWFTSFSIGFDF